MRPSQIGPLNTARPGCPRFLSLVGPLGLDAGALAKMPGTNYHRIDEN
jgi:hypothetical protein